MEQKYKIVIGISGAKNSGKDTAASMIHYIFKVVLQMLLIKNGL